MRVLMLNYEFPPIGGGAGNANYYLLREFAGQKDITIDLITSCMGPDTTEKFADNITIHYLDVGKKALHFWKMTEILRWTCRAERLSKRLIKRHHYDICHCWFGWPSGVIGYLNRKKVPYIVALRGSDVPGYSKRLALADTFLFRPLSKVVWKHAKAVVANSTHLAELAKETYPGRIDVIPNGVDTRQFRPRRHPFRHRVLSVGRLIPRKGFDILIHALTGTKYSLTIVGDGPERKNLATLAKKCEVPLTITGAVSHDEMPRYYQSHDIFALASKNEGMSNAVLEAMACGMPIVMTDVGGAEELVNMNGQLVCQDAGYIREALKNLSICPAGRTSRRRALNMNWRSVASQNENIWRIHA